MTNPHDQLADCRARIDALDEQLAQLLLARTDVVRDVAALKAAHWPNACYIRPGREGQMHQHIAQRFTNTDIPPVAALAIWRQLIGASTHLESPLAVSYGVQFPEHLWLAREYFGLQVGLTPAASLEDMLSQITSGQSNILLLPMDLTLPCWQAAPAIHQAGLRIFAALPTVAGTMPAGMQSALALAVLAPETSGDDISYHFNDGDVQATEGFAPMRVDALFLGAHPRPISL